MGIVQLMLKLGNKEVFQDFVVCRQLKRDVILGADFEKNKTVQESSGPPEELEYCH